MPADYAFLFTDIAGSSRLWEAHADAMEAALAEHDALLRTAIEAAGGSVFSTMGDGMAAAFPDVDSALRALGDDFDATLARGKQLSDAELAAFVRQALVDLI